MHRLVMLQVVTPKLHTVPMRTVERDAEEILNEVIGKAETE